MEYLLSILIFLAGGIAGYFYFKSSLKKWILGLSKKIEALNILSAEDLTEGKKDHQIPKEFLVVIRQLETIFLNQKKATVTKNPEKKQDNEISNLRKLIDHLYIVNELGQKVTSSLNLSQTFDHLYSTINSMMDAAVLELRVYDKDTDEWNVFSNIQFEDRSSEKQPFNNHMAEWSFKNNREVFLEDAEKDFGRYVFNPLELPENKIAGSVMIFPITENNSATGTLSIISYQKNMYSDYHQEIIRLLLGYISVAIDNAITHDELNRTKIRAEQSEKFKEQFLANMSHEIRTPIHAVTGMTRLLIEKEPKPDQLRYLESIKNASDSLLVIINDILDLSKIEAGKIEFEKIEFSISETVNNIQEIMHFKAEEKGLSFNIKYKNKFPIAVIGDPTRLSQILINLLGNAIKFTESGSVNLYVQLISSDNNSGLFEFIVSDTGIGMTEEQQSRLFKEYSQASSATSRKYGGTGLGLNISHQLINLQGGNIHVESALNKGSKFVFRIPYEFGSGLIQSNKDPAITAEMISGLNGIKVLIVDDNEYNRIVAKETLEMKINNVVIHEAVDGKMAIEMISSNNYDVILMDLIMPVMDGFATSKYIRKQLKSPKNSVKIIALTASVIASEIEKSKEFGMDDFIPKPFSTFDLIGTIHNVLMGPANQNFFNVPPKNNYFDSNESSIDIDYLIQLTEGDTNRMQKFIDTFLLEIPVATESLQESFIKNDFEAIRIISHNMKPRLTSLGLGKGLDLAQQIELISAGDKNKNLLQNYIDELIYICNNAVNELSNYTVK